MISLSTNYECFFSGVDYCVKQPFNQIVILSGNTFFKKEKKKKELQSEFERSVVDVWSNQTSTFRCRSLVGVWYKCGRSLVDKLTIAATKT